MPRFWMIALAVVVGWGLPSHAASKWPLDAKQRQMLDHRALAQPLLNPLQARAAITGAVPAFLLTALDLPSTEEHRRSQRMHQELVKHSKLVDPPISVSKILDRLVDELPAYQLPEEFRYSLTVLDRKTWEVFTPGGGYIFLTNPLLNTLLSDRERGEAALAFLLARQIGHSALGHCRRGWQWVILEEDARRGIDSGIEPGVWREVLETKVTISGRIVEFLYSLNQEYRADLFAFQLCRNAGFELDAALDGMRYLANHSEKEQRLQRLKRLLQERDGTADPASEFGLFRWDRTAKDFIPCKPGEIDAEVRPIVFVHGMYGKNDSWQPFLDYFSEQKSLKGRPLLVFRHPGNGSIARSGLMLSRQVRELLPSPQKVTFICHSAGGLVFRWYAEKLKGKFDRAVLMATPHSGSNLTQLKFLVDLQEFFIAARFGLNEGIQRVIIEGRGEIGQDLHPGSLFFRALGKDRDAAKRYHVFYGEWIVPARARLLEVGFLTLRQTLEPQLLPGMPDGLLKRQAERFLASLELPAEITKGDCIVSVQSANLSGAGKSTKLKLRHLAFRQDEEVMRLVLESITN